MKKYLYIVLFITNFGISQNAGDIDVSFANNGRLDLLLADADNRPVGIVIKDFHILPDGKILAAGSRESGCTSSSSTSAPVLFRFNEDGSFDTSLNNQGHVIISGAFQINKLLPINTDNFYAICNGSINKFNTDGIPDSNFGINGSVYIMNDFTLARSGIIDSSNRLLVVGQKFISSESQHKYKICRYLSDGTIDTSFANGGCLELGFGTSSSNAINDVKLDANGNIYTIGYSKRTSYYEKIIVTKLNPNGILDTSYGTNGIFERNYSSWGEGRSLIVEEDGSLIGAGSGNVKLILFKLTPDGILDTSFGNNGIALNSTNPSEQLLEPSKLTKFGNNYIVTGQSSYNLYIAEYNSNGVMTNTFNGNGYIRYPFHTTLGVNSSTSIISNNKIILSCFVTANVICADSKYESRNGRFHLYNPTLNNNDISTIKPISVTNPITNKILKIQNHLSEKYEIELFDLYGKKLVKRNINNNSEEIDLSFLSTGIYILKIKNELYRKDLKIILQ